jgi:serine/threonine protein phosphatase PrpC
MNYKYKSLTDVGLVRKANEDSFGEYKTAHGTLLIVCDGMGGHVGGAVASSTAVEKIHEWINTHDSIAYQNLLYDAIVYANHQVYGLAENKPELRGMGTTAVVVLVTEKGLVYYAHVGDSRLYKLSGNKIERVTKDHSLVQLLVDQGEITEDEMETHPNKNQILKAVGIDFDLRPEVSKEPLQMKEGEILLICSDGLCGMVHDKKIAEITYNNISDLELTTKLLIKEANSNGGKDNITATVVTFGSPQNKQVVLNEIPEKPNNKKFYLYSGILALALLLVIAAYFMFPSKKEELKVSPQCECYKKLNTNIINESDSAKFMDAYNKGKDECDKKDAGKPKDGCTEKDELDKKAKVFTSKVAKIDTGKDITEDEKKKDEDAKKKEEEKKKKLAEEEANKKAEKDKLRVNTKAVCATNHTHYVKPGDKIDNLFDEYVKTCPKLSKQDLIDANKGSDALIADKTILTFDCKCK